MDAKRANAEQAVTLAEMKQDLSRLVGAAELVLRVHREASKESVLVALDDLEDAVRRCREYDESPTRLEAENERLRRGLADQVRWLIMEGYEHAASSFAVYLYPGSSAPLRRFAQDHPDMRERIDAIGWVPK